MKMTAKRMFACMLALALFIGLLPGVCLVNAKEEDTTVTQDNKYYFFDSRIVKSAVDADLTLGTVTKTTTAASWADQYA